MNSRSLLTFTNRIRRSPLIGQVANDPRVNQAEAAQIIHAMQEKNIITYVHYPNEGHDFTRSKNDLSFNAMTKAFLISVLEGRFEPIGDNFKGFSAPASFLCSTIMISTRLKNETINPSH